MRVLFVKTSIGTNTNPHFDMGIGLISAVLKKAGHETSYFFLNDWENLNSLKKRLDSFRPEAVGFAAVEPTFGAVLEIAKFIKKYNSKIFCFCGGVYATLNPDAINETKYLDAVCLGEGEESVLEMIEALSLGGDGYKKVPGFWVREGKKIIKNKNRNGVVDINKLPIADREIFANEGRLQYQNYGEKENEQMLEFIFSRGCPFRCTYCCNHKLSDFYGSGYVRYMDPMKAVDEIEAVIKKYRADRLLFHDDIFTLKKDWLFQFLKLYREKVALPFECNARVGVCDKETFGELKKSGCVELKFGLESGDEALRESVLNRRMSNKEIIKAAKIAKELGINFMVFILLGLPEETPKKFRKTIDLVAKINPEARSLNIFYPYKGTLLYETCVKNNYLTTQDKSSIIEREDTVLNMPQFSREAILYYFKNFDSLVNFRKKSFQKGLVGWHCRFLYFLYSEAPGEPYFKVKQFLYKVDRIFVGLIKQVWD